MMSIEIRINGALCDLINITNVAPAEDHKDSGYEIIHYNYAKLDKNKVPDMCNFRLKHKRKFGRLRLAIDAIRYIYGRNKMV